jgi:phage protein U
MLVGMFGTLIFECSSRRVHSYEDLKVSNSARYATHDTHLELPVLEYCGPNLSEVKFRMNFNTSWGAPPEVSIRMLRQYARYGFVSPLITANKPVGFNFNLWVCIEAGEEHKWVDGRGQLFGAYVDVSLKEYRVLLD